MSETFAPCAPPSVLPDLPGASHGSRPSFGPPAGGEIKDWVFGHLTPSRYRGIIADPPWKTETWSDKGLGKSPERHYATMTMDELMGLPVAALGQRRCILFLWTTAPMLDQSLQLGKHWGFEYKSFGPWVKRTKNWKPAFGTGKLVRNAAEAFLIMTRGQAMAGTRSQRNLIETEDDLFRDLDGWEIDALRREHSRKPDQMRELVDRMVAGGPACELFAREPWPGRDVWGFETSKFASAATQTWQKGEAVLSGEGPSASPCEGGKFGGGL